MAAEEPPTFRVRRIPAHVDGIHLGRFLCDVVPGLDISQLHICSLAPTPDDHRRSPSQTATLQIWEPLPQPLAAVRNGECPVKVPGQRLPLVFDTHFWGFTPLNRVIPKVHDFDLVALSGLASHPFGSWKKHASNSAADLPTAFMWLRDQLPYDFPNIRVMIYGYDTKLLKSESIQTIDDLAISFILHLKSIGKSQTSSKPLMLFAHSLGGLIVKRAMCLLANSGESESFILDTVPLVLFFGVPSAGMKMSYLLPMVGDQPNRFLIDCLSEEDPDGYLRSLNDSFHGISSLRHIRLVSAFETQRTRTALEVSSGKWARIGQPVVLVTRNSAIQRGSRDPEDIFPIDRDHSDMVKFVEDDIHYSVVRSYLESQLTHQSRILITNTRESLLSLRRNATDQDEVPDSSGGMSSTDRGLMSLSFPEIGYRSEQIDIAHEKSFEWLFDRGTGLKHWLKDESKLFWIRGKPGSGKSTLMKHLQTALSRQAVPTHKTVNPDRLLIWFFFHQRGSYLEKSLEGLMRSVLHQLGRKIPSASGLIEQYYSEKPLRVRDVWTTEMLLDLFRLVKQRATYARGIILFLDALDEFNGFPETVADFLGSLLEETKQGNVGIELGSKQSRVRRSMAGSTSSKDVLNIKICFTSRPWDVFVERFHQCDGFKLQEWTRNDIATYARDRLIKMIGVESTLSSGTPDLRKPEVVIERMVSYIDQHAEGVFLWVRLVLDELKNASDRKPESLLALLAQFPTELQNYYNLTMGRIAPASRHDVYIILEMVLRNSDAVTIHDLFYGYQSAKGSTFDSCRQLLLTAQAQRLNEPDMSLQLIDLCGGLLEVVETRSSPAAIQFVHQSVNDYLSRPESGFRQRLLGRTQIRELENGYLFWVKYTFAKFDPLYGRKDIPWAKLSRLCLLAEYTSGQHFGSFLDSVPEHTFKPADHSDYIMTRMTEPIFNSRLSFAVASDLRLYLSYYLERNADQKLAGRSLLLNSNPYIPLLHILCAGARQGHASLREENMPEPSLHAMAQLLVDSGADIHAHFDGVTAFVYLIRCTGDAMFEVYHTFLPCMVDVADVLLGAGCDPDTNLTATWHWAPGVDAGFQAQRCPPLHLSSGNLTNILLKHGANPNAVDDRGHTPLDVRLCIMAHDLPSWLPGNLLNDVRLLIQHGGVLSPDGHAIVDTKEEQLRNWWYANLTGQSDSPDQLIDLLKQVSVVSDMTAKIDHKEDDNDALTLTNRAGPFELEGDYAWLLRPQKDLNMSDNKENIAAGDKVPSRRVRSASI